jgi:acetoin utilization deacetylase AcuC-like enzyme
MKNKVGYVYDPVYLRHETGEHPENPQRLEAIMALLARSGLKERLALIEPRPATEKELALVHREAYITRIKEIGQAGGGYLDSETIISPGSFDAALYAAGGVIRAVDAVMAAEANAVFALVRPPGHHATPGQAMGFCIFNNVAIAASYALKKHGLKRVAVIDFDVHHGNGTQEAFVNDPAVLYVSTHQYPHYPGSGGIGETGRGQAAGTKVNIPLPRGCGDAEYQRVFEQIIIPVVKRFHPGLILVSAGYDPHWADGLAEMRVTVKGFAWMVSTIKALADELCEGRLVLGLEGGYNLEALAYSVKATFDVLLGETEIEDRLGPPPHYFPPDIDSLVAAIKKTHCLVSP